MGINDLFDSNANLENIVDSKSIFVGSLIQKTKISIDETGEQISSRKIGFYSVFKNYYRNQFFFSR